MKKKHNPPKFAVRFLRWFCSEALIEEIQGDLEEAYEFRRKEHGKLRADLWFISDVFKFFKPYSFEKYSGSKQYLPMMGNYIKVSFRNIVKRKAFSAINMVGLSIGLSAVMLVGFFIHHEMTYDRNFPDHERVFRLVNKYRDQTYTCMRFLDYNNSDYETQLRLIKQLKTYDGVEEACHFIVNMGAIGPAAKWYVTADEREFVRDDFLFTNTGKEFQSIFPQQFLLGNEQLAFSEFQKVVLTETVAETFYGENWRYNNLLEKEIEIGGEHFQIGGVIADNPGNIHFTFGMIIHQKEIPSWAGYTYYKTRENTTGYDIVNRLNVDVESVYPGYNEDILSKGIEIVPLTSIHFTDGMLYELKTVANAEYLFTFGIVGLVILLIIWTNYANLSIATYAGRQKELGVRKVMGARSKDVALQVIVESLLLTILCFPFIWLILRWIIPYFNELLDIIIDPSILMQPIVLVLFLVILLVTGLISGLYPAVVFGNKSMLKLFYGKLGTTKSRNVFQFRRVLLTIQFFMLVGLMSLAITIMQQMNYVQEKSLGYEKDGILFFDVGGVEKFNQLRSELEQFPEIVSIGNGIIPGADMYNQLTYTMKDIDEVLSDGTHLYTSYGSMEVLDIGSDAFNLLDQGQDSVFLINQTAANKLAAIKGVSPKELIGETLIMEPEWENEEFGNGIHYTIAGIVEDFDYFSLKYESQSLLLEVRTNPQWVYNMLIRANTSDWISTVAKIEEAYLRVEKDRPLDITFLDDHLNQLYLKERNAGRLASGLTIICVILSIMGLIGIVGFITLSRQKEMGIRKVFGATIAQLLIFISKEYLMMMIVATVFAIPVAIYLANQWLNSFAYRITPGFMVVVLSGLITLAIVILVVMIQSYRSANMNPSDTLRYE